MSSTFESLQERLSAFQETNSQAKDLIAQIEAYCCSSAPLPSSTNPHQDDGDQQGQHIPETDEEASDLVAEALQILEEQKDDLEEIEEEVRDLRAIPAGNRAAAEGGLDDEGRKHEKMRLVDGVGRASHDLKMTKLSLRTAQSLLLARTRSSHLRYREAYLAEIHRISTCTSGAATPNLDPSSSVSSLPPQQQPQQPQPTETTTTFPPTPTPPTPTRPLSPRSARRALFTSSPLLQNPRSHTPQDPSASPANTEITTSLLRMHASISTSLSQSTFAQTIMADSSTSLKSLSDQYDSLDSLLEKSRGLLGVLVKSAKTDAWYLQTSVYMLLSTLAWLAFRRWFYGPLWWVVWMPLRLLWGTGKVAVSVSGTGADAGQKENMASSSGAGSWKGAAGQVEGIDDAVPTIQVDIGGVEGNTGDAPSTEQGEARDSGDSAEGSGEQEESMVDKAGKIIDEQEKRNDGRPPPPPPEVPVQATEERGEKDEL